ncbi:MAG: hypothetical protein UZ14_CFX002000050 [Chloroflexi bacterium OLB14]|nr:MAG: hypothetical protein UZ14_CFX002000050 [Chloroflexi bacterium OLB14]
MSKLLDKLSEYLAHRKGLLPIIGILLIIVNLAVQFIFPNTPLAYSNIFLHVGLIVAVLGLMLAWAL